MNILFIFSAAAIAVNLLLSMVVYLFSLQKNFITYMISLIMITVTSMLCLSWICAKFCGGMKGCIGKYEPKLSFSDNALLVVFGFGSCMTVNLIVSILVALFPFMGGANSDISDRTDSYSIMLMILAAAVSPALCEETAFRGFAMGSLADFGQGFAVVLSSLVFGMMHGNLSGILFAFSVGLVLACIRKTAGSLVPSALVHFLNNAFSVWMSAFSKSMNEEVYAEIILLFYVVMLLMTLVSGIIIYKRKWGLFEFSDNGCTLSTGEKVKLVLKSPFWWVFAVLAFIIGIAA